MSNSFQLKPDADSRNICGINLTNSVSLSRKGRMSITITSVGIICGNKRELAKISKTKKDTTVCSSSLFYKLNDITLTIYKNIRQTN
ncbi:piggyBac transposable element-derived protein 4-like [Vespula squamosa]|uniref:PiggyBac transposable element-derived protein 4-like n=1 Tax=Vespula squamosa TaxID=30214 RepID=A0ABD1ZXX1_VESSQ